MCKGIINFKKLAGCCSLVYLVRYLFLVSIPGKQDAKTKRKQVSGEWAVSMCVGGSLLGTHLAQTRCPSQRHHCNSLPLRQRAPWFWVPMCGGCCKKGSLLPKWKVHHRIKPTGNWLTTTSLLKAKGQMDLWIYPGGWSPCKLCISLPLKSPAYSPGESAALPEE